MPLRFTAALVLGCSIFVVALGNALQTSSIQAASDPISDQQSSHPAPTNLKVLPKDISGDDIDKLMHGYEKQLGVPCGYPLKRGCQRAPIAGHSRRRRRSLPSLSIQITNCPMTTAATTRRKRDNI
jgi:hypothetical protein